MPLARVWVSFLHFAYRQFYNRFAFTYDVVSAIVSRGEWREWTRAAIPFVRGKYVLEIAFGTGNLLLDLAAVGYTPVGVDLSPFMIDITRRKFRRRGMLASLVRAQVQCLPFPSGQFDSAIMTFPPGFAADVRVNQHDHIGDQIGDAVARIFGTRGIPAEDSELLWTSFQRRPTP